MSILKEAGVIDNGCSPTGNLAGRERLIAIRRKRRSMLYEVWDGESRRPAKPIDSHWWKMYVAHPMINVPKFWHRFRMPYSQFIRFVHVAKENNWFPHWSR
jgi:hypothetical protein